MNRENSEAKNQRALVVYSGGMDSTTALYWARREYAEVATISIAYGAKHNAREYAAAQKICALLGVANTRLELPFIGQLFTSSLLQGGAAIPHADYAPENLTSTIVPFRNGIMLAVAAGFAADRNFAVLILGNHGGDHEIYPDCRPEFIAGMATAIRCGTHPAVELLAPFCYLTKTQIAQRGKELGVDFALTYSCYEGGAEPCGQCATCRERARALREAGITTG
jgi:7-cyano-7-deazaguanine synthase